MEHSGARNCSLKDDIDATLNRETKADGHCATTSTIPNKHRTHGAVTVDPFKTMQLEHTPVGQARQMQCLGKSEVAPPAVPKHRQRTSNPKEVKIDTTCRKSTPMPRADRFTPL
jgi:hypothetical protein